MLSTESGRTQVWTSLIATVVLIAFWPLVRRNLKKRNSLPAQDVLGEETTGTSVTEH